MSKLLNRIDKLEKTAQLIEHDGQQVIRIRKLSGEEAEEAERKYILHQARASLGLCEPSHVIFLSKRLKLIKEDYSNFPWGISEEMAMELIQECENAAA